MPVPTNTNLKAWYESNGTSLHNVSGTPTPPTTYQLDGQTYGDIHGEKGDTSPGTGIEETNVDNTNTSVTSNEFTPQFDSITKYKDVHGEKADINPGTGIEETNYINTQTNVISSEFLPQYNQLLKYSTINGEYMDLDPGVGIDAHDQSVTTTNTSDPAFTPQFDASSKYKDVNGEFGDTNVGAGIEAHDQGVTTTNQDGTDYGFTQIYQIGGDKYRDIHGQYIDISPDEGIQESGIIGANDGIGSTGTNISGLGAAQTPNTIWDNVTTYSSVNGTYGDTPAPGDSILSSGPNNPFTGNLTLTNIVSENTSQFFNFSPAYEQTSQYNATVPIRAGSDVSPLAVKSQQSSTEGGTLYLTNPGTDNALSSMDHVNYYKGTNPISTFSKELFGASGGNRYDEKVLLGSNDPDNSPLAKYAMLEESDSALKTQYLKFNLRKDSPNKFSWGAITDQPYILRGIQRSGGAFPDGEPEPQTWGFGLADADKVPAGLGDIAALVERFVFDIIRVGKFAISPNGIFWLDKLFGIQSLLLSRSLGSRITRKENNMLAMSEIEAEVDDPSGDIMAKATKNATSDRTPNWQTLTYMQILKARIKRKGGKSIHAIDFRAIKGIFGRTRGRDPGLGKNFYMKNSLEAKLGYPNSGQFNVDRTKPFALHDNDYVGNIHDKINMLMTGDQPAEGAGQLIKFNFHGIQAAQNDEGTAAPVSKQVDAMYFRESITGLTDAFVPTYVPINYIGRSSGGMIYQNTVRNIGFNFEVYANSKNEMAPMWNKLNTLASYTYPHFFNSIPNGQGMPGAPIMTLTVGDLYVDLPGVLTTFNITFPDNAMWDIYGGGVEPEYENRKGVKLTPLNNGDYWQLPRHCSINVGFAVINHEFEQAGKMNLFGPPRTVQADGSVDLKTGLPYLNNNYPAFSDPTYNKEVETPGMNLMKDLVPDLDTQQDPGQDDDSVIGGLAG
tara:strand:- start:8622 stop:11477 length:2856 start_codon:yes stop_codon:yes gene_type:complete